MDENKPIDMVRIEFASIKHQVSFMLKESSDKITETIESYFAEIIESGKINKIIEEQSRQAVEGAVKSAVKRYYEYGPGKESIYKIAKAKLDQDFDVSQGDDQAHNTDWQDFGESCLIKRVGSIIAIVMKRKTPLLTLPPKTHSLVLVYDNGAPEKRHFASQHQALKKGDDLLGLKL